MKFEEAVSTKCVIGTSAGMQGLGVKSNDAVAVAPLQKLRATFKFSPKK
jgi:hypothetical protein